MVAKATDDRPYGTQIFLGSNGQQYVSREAYESLRKKLILSDDEQHAIVGVFKVVDGLLRMASGLTDSERRQIASWFVVACEVICRLSPEENE